jgi:hypothetical protein
VLGSCWSPAMWWAASSVLQCLRSLRSLLSMDTVGASGCCRCSSPFPATGHRFHDHCKQVLSAARPSPTAASGCQTWKIDPAGGHDWTLPGSASTQTNLKVALQATCHIGPLLK